MDYKSLILMSSSVATVFALSYFVKGKSGSLAEYFGHPDGCACARCNLQEKIEDDALTLRDLQAMEMSKDTFLIPRSFDKDVYRAMQRDKNYEPTYFGTREKFLRAVKDYEQKTGRKFPRSAHDLEMEIMRGMMTGRTRSAEESDVLATESMLGAEVLSALKKPIGKRVFVESMRQELEGEEMGDLGGMSELISSSIANVPKKGK